MRNHPGFKELCEAPGRSSTYCSYSSGFTNNDNIYREKLAKRSFANWMLPTEMSLKILKMIKMLLGMLLGRC